MIAETERLAQRAAGEDDNRRPEGDLLDVLARLASAPTKERTAKTSAR